MLECEQWRSRLCCRRHETRCLILKTQSVDASTASTVDQQTVSHSDCFVSVSVLFCIYNIVCGLVVRIWPHLHRDDKHWDFIPSCSVWDILSLSQHGKICFQPVYTGTLHLCHIDLKPPLFLNLWKFSILACPILRSETLPGADDLFGSHSTPRRSPVLLILVLWLYGVDTTLWRNIHFNLEKTVR